MQLLETKNQYGIEDSIFSFQDTFFDSLKLNVYVECSTEKFLQYQKDILEDFVADFVSKIQENDSYEMEKIKQTFESSLQGLNIKLHQFADKVHDVEKFNLKWFIQLVADNLLMWSMLGEVSLLILRDQKILYTLENISDHTAKIDSFSDIVEGDLEWSDQIVYVGTKLSDVINQQDRKELESILIENDSEETFVTSLESVLLSRMDSTYLSFIISYIVKISFNLWNSRTSRWWFSFSWELNTIWEKIQASNLFKTLKNKLWKNKIYFITVIFWIAIILLLSSLFSQFWTPSEWDTRFQTASGTYIDLTIDDIQKEMAEFQSLDASSNEKSIKYAEIMQKLDFIESKGKWLQDVKSLKSILQSEYYKGFNIIPIEKLTQFTNWSRILAFNSAELSRLWTLRKVFSLKNLAVAWTKGVLLDITSDTNRGNLIDLNAGNNLQDCTLSLLRDGLYCYTEWDDLFLVNKTGITPLETDDGSFKNWIWGLGIFNKNNFYIFQKTLSSIWNVLVTRYRNVAGSETNFQGWSSYQVLTDSGMNFSEFGSFAIDGSFFGWSNRRPYLFWRTNGAGTDLSYREIPIKWWEILLQEFTDKVKIITSSATKYIYLFDQEKQLFVAYETVNPKTNDDNKALYAMKYLFSFKFMIEGHPVIDMNVSEASWDKPELYILNDEGVYKVALYEFIDSIRNNDTLKTVPAAQ